MSLALNLTAESILRPTPLDVFEVEAMMLWPDDARAREIGLRAAMTEHSIEHLPEAPPDVLEHVRHHLKSGAPRIKDIEPKIRDRQWHGCIAGLLMARVSVGMDLLGSMALGKLQAELCRNLKPAFQIEPRTMNNKTNKFYKFRPVAHLWGAYTVRLGQGLKAFPCTVDELPEFLAAAEAIREKAEATLLPKSDDPVMRPGEAVRMPDSVRRLLPAVNFIRNDLSRNESAIREKTRR